MSNKKRNQQKQKNNNRKRGSRKMKGQVAQKRIAMTGRLNDVSPCTLTYIEAINNAWSERAMKNLPCVPYFPAVSSRRQRVFTRFTFGTGTNKWGAVFFSPCLVRDRPAAFSTLTTNTWSNSSLLEDILFNSETHNFSSLLGDYASSTADVANESYPAQRGRVVSMSYRIKDEGSENYIGGGVYQYAGQDHQNVVTLGSTVPTVANVSGFQRTHYHSQDISRRTAEGSIIGLNDGEWSFGGKRYATDVTGTNRDFVYPFSRSNSFTHSDTNAYGSPVEVVLVRSAEAGRTYTVELVQFVEYIGSDFQDSLVPTHIDVNGFSVVTESHRAAKNRVGGAFASAFKESLRESAKQAGYSAGALVRAAGNSALSYGARSLGAVAMRSIAAAAI